MSERTKSGKDTGRAEDSDVRFEILLPRPIGPTWLAFRDPSIIRRWFGWEYDGLGPEIKSIFVDGTKASRQDYTLHIGGHLFTLTAPDEVHTKVRVTRAEPLRVDGDDVDWDLLYDDIEQGWIAFLQQLRFLLARHPEDKRRTIFRVGGSRSGTPLPLPDLLGLSAANRTPAGEPYVAEVGPGDRLEGEVWYHTDLQLGVTVDAWGDGLLVLTHSPSVPQQYGAASMTLTTYSMSDEAYADLEARWGAWFDKRYEAV
jgi:hypothetical protein